MKNRIVITDNCREKDFSDLKATQQAIDDLRLISDRRIDSLLADGLSDLLIFPNDYGDFGDDLGSGVICSITGNKLSTGNIMGFVGVGSTSLTIRSRFRQNTQQDFFLYYMLFKVLSINIMKLKHDFSKISTRDFLVFLFPVFLEEALRQGVYREYSSAVYDNYNVKGAIDVARQIKKNIPFTGKIAYSTREHSFDNRVTQLIRHTIEYIDTESVAGFILNENEGIRNAVRAIKEVTISYSSHALKEVIYKNLQPLAHPYFTSYMRLQKLCLEILRNNGLIYGRGNSDIYGVLFDGAWLWEEYLNTVLRDLGFSHAHNKSRRNGVNLFTGSHTLFPDFYNLEQGVVVDAKYKRLESGTHNKDLHQLVCYMYILRARAGAFIYPSAHCSESAIIGDLNGYGGRIYKIPVFIDQKAQTMDEFIDKMEGFEKKLCDDISKLLNNG